MYIYILVRSYTDIRIWYTAVALLCAAVTEKNSWKFSTTFSATWKLTFFDWVPNLSCNTPVYRMQPGQKVLHVRVHPGGDSAHPHMSTDLLQPSRHRGGCPYQDGGPHPQPAAAAASAAAGARRGRSRGIQTW